MRGFRDQPIQGSGVALAANFGKMAGGFRAALNPMRIVAGVASQSALAFEKTSGFPKPICGTADDLELIVMLCSRCMVERQKEIGKRLAGNERKRRSIEPADQGRNCGAGRLQVTLHAEIHAQFRAKPGGIHDARADLLGIAARGLRRANVIAAGSMTALAIDAFRNVAAKYWLAPRTIVPGRYTRISIVAKNAFI